MTACRIAAALLCLGVGAAKARDWSELTVLYRAAAIAELSVGVLLASGWRPRFAYVVLILMGLGFSTATLLNGVGRGCQCLGAHVSAFGVRLGIALAVLVLGGLGLLLHAQAKEQES